MIKINIYISPFYIKNIQKQTDMGNIDLRKIRRYRLMFDKTEAKSSEKT